MNHILGSDCPRRISILSSGRATTWEEKLGSYTLLNYDDDGRAVYENDLKNGNFLFSPKNNDDTWMVSKFCLFLTIPIKNNLYIIICTLNISFSLRALLRLVTMLERISGGSETPTAIKTVQLAANLEHGNIGREKPAAVAFGMLIRR